MFWWRYFHAITILKTCLHPKLFKIARRASLEKLLFSKVIWENSTLHNSFENCTTCIRLFRKVALLEISRNLQFPMLLKLKTQPNFLNVQTDVCNPILSLWTACLKLQIPVLRILEIQGNSWDNLSCGVPFFQKQMLADSLRNTCSKQFYGKVAGRFSSVLKYESTKDVLLENFQRVVYKKLNIVFKVFSMLMLTLRRRRRDFQVAVCLL